MNHYLRNFLYEEATDNPSGGGGGGGNGGGGAATTILSSEQQQQQQQDKPPGQQQQQPATTNDWIQEGKFAVGFSQRLPDHLKEHAATLSKFENVPLEDVLKSYGALEKKIGSRVQAPGPEAKPEEVAAWRKITGAPEKIEDYGIKKPDDIPDALWDSGLADGFVKMAHKHHMSPAAANEMVGWFNEHMKGEAAKMNQGFEAQQQEVVSGLQKDWGDKFASNVQAARRVATIAKLDVSDPNVGNNPAVIRALYEVSNLISDDKALSVGAPGGSRLTGAEEADDIQSNQSNPYHDDYMGKNGPERQQKAADRVRKLRVSSVTA